MGGKKFLAKWNSMSRDIKTRENSQIFKKKTTFVEIKSEGMRGRQVLNCGWLFKPW